MAGKGSLGNWNELLQQPIYDSDFLTVGAVTSGDDFVTSEKHIFRAQGAGNLNRTNLTQAGQLPAGQAFKVYACRSESIFYPINGAATATGFANTQELAIANLMATSVEFKITDSIVLQAPVAMVPAGVGPWGVVYDSANALITNGHPANPSKYVLRQPQVLESFAGIGVVMKRSTLGSTDVITGINTYTGLKVGRFYLDGMKLRSATGK